MNLKINSVSFRGPLDGAVTGILRACDTNEMVNAVGLDVGAMVIPRSYYDSKARNEYAGAETFFRELSGTFINCISASLFAGMISKIISKHVMSDVKTNPSSWFTRNSLETLNAAWNKGNNTKEYVTTVFNNMSGHDGHNINKFENIDWNRIEWIDEKIWDKIKWKDAKYKGIQDKLKTKDGIINEFCNIIHDNNLCKEDKQNVLSVFEKRITNALGVNRSIEVNIDNHKLESSLINLLRDTHDMGKDIFTNKLADTEKAIKKINKVNKIKAFGAITLSCILGLTNQYINRKITEKRTGKKGFVGDVDFVNRENEEQKKDKTLIFKKFGASALMLGMVACTMKVKNFKEFAKKLEFTGPVTSGNAIKTVYGAVITGRFMAADNGTELRESMTRDYLGFLNWLVFGGFAAKGVANLLDKKGENLFNYKKEGKGIKHWLNDMTLKTHNELASKGKEFAKKNMWKLNVANAAGIAYSAITLGILLPMLNAKITNKKAAKNNS